MKIVILKSVAPLEYSVDSTTLSLAGGCEINKVDDQVWDKIYKVFKSNIDLLQERGILEVSNSKGNSKANQKLDEEKHADLKEEIHEKQEAEKPENVDRKKEA